MHLNFKNFLLLQTKSADCEEIEIIQSLWSGYGRISRYRLHDSSLETVVVKFISLQQFDKHPRGWNTSYSHRRKVKSYEIETNWYEQWSHFCSLDSKVPKVIGTYSEEHNRWIVLEDLNSNFPIRKTQLSLNEVKVCLRWLAHFHATFLNYKPKGLWEVGTYWHLNTRPDEFNEMEDSELKSKAHIIDQLLNECNYQTIVHGDAKLANFCFSEDGKQVAAVDFQYVGGGVGVKDVTYFLGSCLSGEECEIYEEELLDWYFLQLKNSCSVPDLEYKELEQEWRALYPIACADFMRFLLGWMPSHQKINNYNRNIVDAVVSSL